MLGGDDDVAGERQLEPAAEREAVHRRDQRLPEIVARDQSSEAALRHARHTVQRGPLEVVAGREGAITRAGQDRHPDLGVGHHVVPHAREFLVGRRMERVHHLRAVDRHVRDPIALLVADERAPHFRVVAPDMRGYNESDKPAGVCAYAMSELVADVDGLLRAFGEHEAVIVGHDWGGAVAWSFAMERPNATRRLVVLNCPHPAIFVEHLRGNRRQLARSWYMFFFQIPWLPETLLRLGGAWAIGAAIRRSTVREDSLTDEDLRMLRAAASRPG